MINKYSAKLSGLKRVKWDNKTEKQKANYFKKIYTDLGLSIPNYLINGKMSAKQLQSNINKLTKNLQSRANKERQRNKVLNKKAEQTLKTMKKEYEKYVNTLPIEYRNSTVFMNYFTKGHGLRKSSYDIPGWGFDYSVFSTLKDMKDYYQADSNEEIISIMNSLIKEMKNNSYSKQIKRLGEKALKEINRLENELNDGMYSPNSENLKVIIKTNKLPFHHLIELNRMLENNSNVFDSVYNNNKIGGGQEDFNVTIKKIYDISKRNKISDFLN